MRFRWIGKRATGKARDKGGAARLAFENFEGNVFLLQDGADVFRRGDFVAVGSVDADQILEPDESFVRNFGNVG